MHFPSPQLLLLLLLPVKVLSQAFQNTTQAFYLRTHHLSGNKAYANLYPQTYHTGAGQSSVVLTPSRAASLQSYLYDTTRLNVFRTHSFPCGWYALAPPYTRWGNVGANVGLPEGGGEGWSLVKSGTRTVVQFREGRLWLVCEWWFGVPQVWWLVDWWTQDGGVETPRGCAVVELVVEWI